MNSWQEPTFLALFIDVSGTDDDDNDDVLDDGAVDKVDIELIECPKDADGSSACDPTAAPPWFNFNIEPLEWKA